MGSLDRPSLEGLKMSSLLCSMPGCLPSGALGHRTIFPAHFQEGHLEGFPELFQTLFSQIF